MNQHPLRHSLSLLALTGLTPLAHASLLVADNFSGYTPDYLPSQSVQGTGLTGSWSSPDSWASVSPVNLAGPANSGQLANPGGQTLTFSGGTNPSAAAGLTSSLSTVSNTYFISFVGQFTGNPGGVAYKFDGIQLYAGATNVLSLGSGDGSTWGLYDGTSFSSAAGTNSAVASFVVYQVTFGAAGGANDSVSLFVNPGIAGQPAGPTATWTGLSLSDSSLTNMTLRATGSGTNRIGDIRIGTTYADVAAVPEPATYGLIGAGTLAAAALVRRRRKSA